MGRRFIELYDDDGFRYFVNIDKIVNVSVDNKRVWTGEKSSLYICGESMDRLCDRLMGDGEEEGD